MGGDKDSAVFIPQVGGQEHWARALPPGLGPSLETWSHATGPRVLGPLRYSARSAQEEERWPLPTLRSPLTWAPDSTLPRTGSRAETRRWARAPAGSVCALARVPLRKDTRAALGQQSPRVGDNRLPPAPLPPGKGNTSTWGIVARWLVSSCSLESLTTAQPRVPSGRGARAPVSLWLCPATTHSAAPWARAWLRAGRAAPGGAGRGEPVRSWPHVPRACGL